MNVFGKLKSKDEIYNILEFVSFLFEYDSDDVSLIVKTIYEQMGPSDTFLLWAKEIANRALKFFV